MVAGALDGRIFIYDAASGDIVWQYDTLRDFTTLNGVEGKGGSIDSQSVFAGAGHAVHRLGLRSVQPGARQRVACIPPEGEVMHRPPRIFAAIVLLVAIAFLYGGVRLLAVGGSLYYVVAGIALLTSAVFLWRGDKRGSHIYGALLVVTLLWSLLEVGTDLWALMPRLLFLSVLGAWLLTPFARRGLYSPDPPPRCLAALEADRLRRPVPSRSSRSSSWVRATAPRRCRRALPRKWLPRQKRKLVSGITTATRRTARATRASIRSRRTNVGSLEGRSGTTAPAAAARSRRRRSRSATCCTSCTAATSSSRSMPRPASSAGSSIRR